MSIFIVIMFAGQVFATVPWRGSDISQCWQAAQEMQTRVEQQNPHMRGVTATCETRIAPMCGDRGVCT